jgi:hypothetical protein
MEQVTINMQQHGVLIDPTSRSIKLVEVSQKVSLKELYELLECNMIEMANPNSSFVDWRDTLIVDEEGLMKDGQEFFKIGGQAYAGKGLILRTTDDGDMSGCVTDLDDIVKATFFPEVQDLM